MLLPYLHIAITVFVSLVPVVFIISSLREFNYKAIWISGLLAILSILGLMAWLEFHPLLDKPIDLLELSYTFIAISGVVGFCLSVLLNLSVISILDRISRKNKRDEKN